MSAVAKKCGSANSEESSRTGEQADALGISGFGQEKSKSDKYITLLEYDALVLNLVFASGPPIRSNNLYSYLDRNEIEVTRRWLKIKTYPELAMVVKMIETAFQRLHKSLQDDLQIAP